MRFKSIYIILLVIGLVAVRFMSPYLFHDPLIEFFHSAEYYNNPLPEINLGFFTISLFIRFAINTSLTLGLVYVLFEKVELIRLTTFIYIGVWVILFPILILLVFYASGDEYRYLFYIRRILIHPVLTLILIPAFLYNDRQVDNN